MTTAGLPESFALVLNSHFAIVNTWYGIQGHWFNALIAILNIIATLTILARMEWS